MGADRVRSQWLFLDPLGEENCVPKVFLQSFTDLARFLLETGMIPGVLELSMAPIAFGSQGGQRGLDGAGTPGRGTGSSIRFACTLALAL